MKKILITLILISNHSYSDATQLPGQTAPSPHDIMFTHGGPENRAMLGIIHINLDHNQNINE